jgi:hypothetical protein
MHREAWASLLLALLHSSSCQTENDACQLPPSWSGSWFESGVRGGVHINLHTVAHKGRCVQQLRGASQFIFKSSQEGNCLRCLSIHQKHSNVLQYKESKCMQERDPRQYKDICRSISVDEPLTSLFRVNATGEDCPVQGTYSFSYSRGHGLCDYPLSSLHQCSDRSKLVFNYQACVDIKGSQSQTEEAQCLGHWKEGSTYYFVAMMNSSYVSRDHLESSFRCFVYKEVHTGFLLSQSAEAKCNLYKANEGFRTMSLRRLKEDGESCKFPSWFTVHRRYHSLSGIRAFQLNKLGTTLTLEEGTKKNALECLSGQVENNNSAIFTVQSAHSCSVGFHCLRIRKKTDNVFQLRIGRLSPNAEDACDTQLFFDNAVPTQTVTTAHLHSSPCPLTGNYALRSSIEQKNCSDKLTLSSGCVNSHKMKLTSSCTQEVTEYSCHDSWKEADWKEPLSKKSFSIVSYKSESTSAKGCFVRSLNENPDELSLSMKKDCREEDEDIWSFSALNYGDCAPTALATSNSALQKSCTWHLVLLSWLLLVATQ